MNESETLYEEEREPIPLSYISEAGYCLRRAALKLNERLWQETADTAKGTEEHRRTHTERIERRGNAIALYEYTVYSEKLGILGKCDCIEAAEDAEGCRIPAVDFPVKLYPVEYKHGKLRAEEAYNMQVCAQAMCLEEMYRTSIPEGAIFYISSHRRQAVQFDQNLRDRVIRAVEALKQVRREYLVPPAEPGDKCRRCSLRELCLPELPRSAADYCRRLEKEARKVEAI